MVKKIMATLKKAFESDAAAVVMGLALAYGYIRFAIAFIDYMKGDGP